MDGIDLSCFKCELGLKHMIFGVYVQEFVGFGAARREKRLMKKIVNKGGNKKNNASTRDALMMLCMKNTSIRIALPQTDPYLHKQTL